MNVESALAALQVCNLPADARTYLVAALKRAGSEQLDLDTRDEWLRTAIKLSPGDSDTARCSFLIECTDGGRKHPSDTARQLLKKLQASGVQVPQSVKQLRRILRGSRQAVGTRNTVLCPSWPLPENTGNTEEKA